MHLKLNKILQKIRNNYGVSLILLFVSILLMVFYIFFYVSGEYLIIYKDWICVDTLTSYIVALFSLLFGGVFLYSRKQCSLNYVFLCVMLTASSFLMIQYITYGRRYYSISQNNIQTYLEWAIFMLISGSIISEVVVQRFNLRKCWVILLFVLQLASFQTDNVFFVICSTCFSLMSLTLLQTSIVAKRKIYFTVVIVLVYVFVSFLYSPYNPIYSFKNISSFGISLNPLRSTLIINEQGKYRLKAGNMFCKDDIPNIQFDSCSSFEPYKLNKFLGLKVASDKGVGQIMSSSIIDIIKGEQIYPIAVGDSCAYFAADISVYNELERIRRTNSNTLESMTSDLFYKYLNFFSSNDSISRQSLINSYVRNNEFLSKFMSDTSLIAQPLSDIYQIPNSTFEQLTELNIISKITSIGFLNAISLDMLNNRDYLTAFKVFSLQFFQTFYNNQQIYQAMSINFNLNNIHLSNYDLDSESAIDPWINMFKISNEIATQYSSECLISSMSAAFNQFSNSIQNFPIQNYQERYKLFDKQALQNFKNEIDNISDILSNYDKCPTLRDYVLMLQTFLYKRITYRFTPEFDGYYLNRLDEIFPIAMLNPQAIELNANLREFYNNKFAQECDTIVKKIAEYQEASKFLENNIRSIDSIDQEIKKLGFDSQINKALKKALIDKAWLTTSD